MGPTARDAGARGTDADVCVVGGGLVGASLACALAPLGLRISLIEAVEPRAASQPSYDDRTLALSASSCRILEALDLWPLLEGNATAIREVHVRERGRPGQVVMQASELGLERLGNVVEARVFGAAVMQRLPELPGVTLNCPARLTRLSGSEGRSRVVYEDANGEQHIDCRLVVGADGAASDVREALGIPAERRPYGQTAVICNVTPERHHDGRAYEQFTPTGPFALLPHAGGRCGLVWTVADDDAEELVALGEGDFLERAQALFGNRLGQWTRCGRRTAYPLALTRAETDCAPRALLLGNAAHAIHPIGAQGFNLGLRDVAALAEVIADALQAEPDADPGSAALLKRYSDWRRADQSATIAYTDGLARLFANPTGIAATLRHAGLLAHALVPSLRRRLAAQAMGYRGKDPRMALGERLGSG